MAASRPKLLIVDVAALSRDLDWPDWKFQPIAGVLPAVTCAVQGSFRTAGPPGRHGMIANGLYDRRLRKAMFWEQSAALVEGERIWSGFRRRGGKVAMLFWQQSLGEDVDVVLSPSPIHKHHGGMIQDCYSQPPHLYRRLCDAVGSEFRLRHYWGPMASAKAGTWIAQATAALLRDDEFAPDLCLAYLPSLDYDLQRHDPNGPEAAAAHDVLRRDLRRLIDSARERQYEVLVFGDYAISPVRQVVYPNRRLAAEGLQKTRNVRGMLYHDPHASAAFVLCDHQVAHVYVRREEDLPAVRQALGQLEGVEEVMDRRRQREVGLDHPNSGELALVAREGAWLAYPWWSRREEAPEYAFHVDIHNKPGYDPCELFWGWPPGAVGQDASRIGGSHGRCGQSVWAGTIQLDEQPRTLIDLAAAVRRWLERA